MNQIYIELPKSAKKTKVSIPCEDGTYLWQFLIIFNEVKNSKTRMVTIYDNAAETECDNDSRIQTKIVKNCNGRGVEFDYEIKEVEMTVKFDIVFCKGLKLISVSW